MILKNLRLKNFRNYFSSLVTFDDSFNFLIGKNGTGKTNLIDAVYYLSFTKSALGIPDKLIVSYSKSFFNLFGEYDQHTIGITYQQGKSKTMKADGSFVKKASEWIGKIPLIVILPSDTLMVMMSSEYRRKFFDGALSQVNQEYLRTLLSYQKIIKQRNFLLKESSSTKEHRSLIDVYDHQLIPLANFISSERKKLVKLFIPYLQKNYKELYMGNEIPNVLLKTQVKDDFEILFKNNLHKDILMGRTMIGSHRDDFEFLLNDNLIKQFSSQGQQKTFIIALKLSLYDFVSEQKKVKPILLLDDIFDKLDDDRIGGLMSLVKNSDRFGQIFITDARGDRSKTLLKEQKIGKFIELA